MPRCRARGAIAAIAGAAAAWASAAQAAAVLRPEVQKEDEYGETFTFMADMDDGSYVHLQLAITNLGPGDASGVCHALVKRTSQPAWTGFDHVGRSGWRHEEGATEKLTVGPCSAASGTDTVVRTVLDGTTVVLKYAAPVDGAAAPLRIETGRRWFQSWVTHRATPASVEVSFADGKALRARGAGYADHSRTITKSKELAVFWARFRAPRSPTRALAAGRRRTPDDAGQMWLWKEERSETPETFAAARTGDGRGSGWKVSVPGPDGPLRLVSGELLHRQNPLSELGWLGSVVSAIMTVPITYTFRGTMQAGDGPPVEGIMEIELPEK